MRRRRRPPATRCVRGCRCRAQRSAPTDLHTVALPIQKPTASPHLGGGREDGWSEGATSALRSGRRRPDPDRIWTAAAAQSKKTTSEAADLVGVKLHGRHGGSMDLAALATGGGGPDGTRSRGDAWEMSGAWLRSLLPPRWWSPSRPRLDPDAADLRAAGHQRWEREKTTTYVAAPGSKDCSSQGQRKRSEARLEARVWTFALIPCYKYCVCIHNIYKVQREHKTKP